MGVWRDSIRIRNQSLKKLRRELHARNIKNIKIKKLKASIKKDEGIVFFLTARHLMGVITATRHQTIDPLTLFVRLFIRPKQYRSCAMY